MLVTTQWPLKPAATSPHLSGFVFYGCLESLTELSALWCLKHYRYQKLHSRRTSIAHLWWRRIGCLCDKLCSEWTGYKSTAVSNEESKWKTLYLHIATLVCHGAFDAVVRNLYRQGIMCQKVSGHNITLLSFWLLSEHSISQLRHNTITASTIANNSTVCTTVCPG